MKPYKIIFFVASLHCLLIVAYPETKLTYPQRQAVQRQESTLKEVEKKVATGTQENEKKFLIQKLENVIADLEKNNCPDDNAQITDIKNRVKVAREKLAPDETKKVTTENDDAPNEEPAKKEPIKEGSTESKTIENKIPEKAKEPTPTSIKLTYQQRQAVDRQMSNLKELETAVAQLNEQEPKIKYYPFKIESGLGYSKKIDGIKNDLEKSGCPKENEQVADIYNRLEKATTLIAELETKLKPKFDLYDKYTNIANYPNYDKDMDQLKRLFKKYNNSQNFYTNKERADELINGYRDDALFFNSLGKTYAPIINFKTIHGENLIKTMGSIKKHMESFHDAKKAYGEALPKEIEGQLNSAKKMAKDAFDNKKPAFFGGGVLQWMDKAKNNLEMLEAILGAEDENVKRLNDSYKKQKDEIASMEKSMEELILAEAKLPEEVYDGSDKENLRSMIQNAWKKQYPNDEIIKIVLHTDGWNRTNKWTYNSASSEWQQSDKSVFVGLVVVKTDDKIATTFPAYINKDHINNDKIKMGIETKGSAYVQRKVLISNIK